MRYFNFRKVREEFKHLQKLQQLSGLRSRLNLKYVALFFGSVAISALVVFALWGVVPNEAALMSGIFVIAGLLWVSEALPLFATAFLVISLEIILLSNPGGWDGLGFEAGESPNYNTFLNPMANPVIFLFLGGFILAQASVKEGIDKALASNILKIFGSKPAIVLFGLMAITAVFSMWMSNTATTAMMIALTAPLLHQIPQGDPFKKALVIAIPFAANVGGLGTPIASPPNAVAVGFLKNMGIEISFLKWILIAMPLMVIMLFVVWGLVWLFYKPKEANLSLRPENHKIDGRGFFVMVVFIITILLWLSDAWHGLPTAVTALFPVVAFTSTGLIRRSDINSLEWHILILIAGGIALGTGMKQTGLDEIVVGIIPANLDLIYPILIVTTIVLSTFMSNTAASNLLIPLGISFATALAPGDEKLSIEIGLGVALAASMAMALPISTPPNAIAYAKGVLSTKDFTVVGGIVGVIAAIMIMLGKGIIGFWL
ncbi:MAG: DASS family sodium-coupled anion symporter [Cyclobacteriaceae bacterium]